MGGLSFVRGPVPDAPGNYSGTTSYNGGVMVTPGLWDPLHTMQLDAGVCLGDNLHDGTIFKKHGTAPSHTTWMPGSVGLDYVVESGRSAVLALNCTDCPGGKTECHIRHRVYHEIYLDWLCQDPLHTLTTGSGVLTRAAPAVPILLVLCDDLNGKSHSLYAFFDHWTGSGLESYMGCAGANSSGAAHQHDWIYRQKPWDAGLGGSWQVNESGIAAEHAGRTSSTGNPPLANDWGMANYGSSVTDFSFRLVLRASYPDSTEPHDLACNQEKALPVKVGFEVPLLATDRGYDAEGQADSAPQSRASATLVHGSYALIWRVDVVKNCDSTTTNCPCTRHGPDNDQGDPSQ